MYMTAGAGIALREDGRRFRVVDELFRDGRRIEKRPGRERRPASTDLAESVVSLVLSGASLFNPGSHHRPLRSLIYRSGSRLLLFALSASLLPHVLERLQGLIDLHLELCDSCELNGPVRLGLLHIADQGL